MSCYICLENITESIVKICTCQGCYHFDCLKQLVESKDSDDTVDCPNCRREIYIPKVYYASKISSDSTAARKHIDQEDLIDYRELKEPFHYRVGHWAYKDNHCGFEDNPLERSIKQISECDYILAEIQTDSHGTIAEIGLAYGLQKPIFLSNSLDWHDIKISRNGAIEVLHYNVEDNFEKPTLPSDVIETSYKDIWFPQGLAVKSLIRLRNTPILYEAWRRHKKFLPHVMRDINATDSDNTGVCFGHYIEHW